MNLDRLSAALSDRYRIEREIGRGGMATVYLAHDLRHDREVAIKVLHEDLGAVLGAERFLTEIKTTARLQHPHILPLLDSGEAGGLLFYVMPFVTGETLRARLERETQLPVADALRIAREVADALAEAHGRGVVHRDIKPENILLQGNHALVADFGIALAVQHAGGARMTQTGLSLGTPQYMAPEQAMGDKAVDHRADIYALGAVTYEMLTGEPPHTGANVQAIVAKLLTEPVRPVRVLRPAVPEHVDATLQVALQKLPADRFATVAEFGAALAGEGGTAAGRQGSAGRSDLPPGRPAVPVLLAIALALVATGAALGWVAARTGPGDESLAERGTTITTIMPPAGGTVAERASLALTPDGRQLAFVAMAADGSRMLWLRRLERGESEPLPNTVGADAPVWSPDGRALGFFTAAGLVVRSERGDVRLLCPASGPINASWGSADTIVFNHRGGVTKVAAGGGPCTVIIPRDSASTASVAFLPDGRRLVIGPFGATGEAIVTDLGGHRLATLPLVTPWLSVVAPDLLVYFSRDRALEAHRIDLGTLTLSSSTTRLASEVRNSGGVPTYTVASSGDLAFLPGTLDQPYLEFDARGQLQDTVRIEGTWTLASRPRGAGPPMVAVAGRLGGLWLYDLDADRATRLTVGEADWGLSPVFSPDGRQLAYASGTADVCGLAVRDLSSGAERTFGRRPSIRTALQGCDLPLDWSPDGRTLLVRRDTALALISLDSGALDRPMARPGRMPEGRFAPDGRWVAVSSDETGRFEIYLQPLPAGAPIRVSISGGRWPAWADGGRTLYFVSAAGRVQAVTVGAGPAPTISAERTLFMPPNWRRSIFLDNGMGFAVIGDGERFIVRQSPAALGVTYLQGWRTLFRRPGESTGEENRR